MLGFNDLLNLFSTDIEWNTHKAAVFRYSHGFCYFHIFIATKGYQFMFCTYVTVPSYIRANHLNNRT